MKKYKKIIKLQNEKSDLINFLIEYREKVYETAIKNFSILLKSMYRIKDEYKPLTKEIIKEFYQSIDEVELYLINKK